MLSIAFLILALLPGIALADILSSSSVTAVRFSSSGEQVAVGRDDGTVNIWDRTQRRWLWQQASPPSMHLGPPVHSVYILEDAQHLLAVEKGENGPSGHKPGALTIYSLTTGKVIRRTVAKFAVSSGVQETLVSADLAPSGRLIAVTGDFFAAVNLLDLGKLLTTKGTGSGPAEIGGGFVPEGLPEDRLMDVRFCGSDRYLAGTTVSGYLVMWDFLSAPKGEPGMPRHNRLYVRKVVAGAGKYKELTGVACSSSAHMVTVGAYSSRMGQIQLWNPESGELVGYIDHPHETTPRGVEVDRAGRYVLTTGWLPTHVLWANEGGKLKRLANIYFNQDAFSPAKRSAGFSPKGDVLAVGYGTEVFLISTGDLRITEVIGDNSRKLTINRVDNPAP